MAVESRYCIILFFFLFQVCVWRGCCLDLAKSVSQYPRKEVRQSKHSELSFYVSIRSLEKITDNKSMFGREKEAKRWSRPGRSLSVTRS